TKAIAALVKFIDTSEDENTRWQPADSLGKIDPGNESAIAALVKFIDTSEDENTRWLAAESLENILPADQMAKVVTALRYEFKPNEERYKVIWLCAQNISYPAFYQAWHHSFNIKIAIRFARYRWWQIALCLFLGLSIFAFVRFTVSHSVNNPANIQRQQQIR
ncbi:MAG: HEAT repeat domain-containing protein, partial [Brasilonema sp.]